MARFRPTVLALLIATALVASTGTSAAFADTAPSSTPAATAAPSPSPTLTDAPAPNTAVTTTPTDAPTPTETPIPTPAPTTTLPPPPTAAPTPTPTPTDALTPVTDLASVSIQLPAGYSLTDLNASKNAIPSDPANEGHAALTLVDPANAANNKSNATLEAIKGRGNFTWTLEKKPYQIKFDSSTSVLGMQKAKTWILLANHADPSLMRNKIAYDLAGAFGLPGSPDSRFIDLTVNGEYLGNYLITEKVEVKANRLELSDPGGILLELDNLYGAAEDFSFRTATSRSTFVLKDAVNGVDAPLAPSVATAYEAIQGSIAQFETEIYATDPEWSKISTMIDVESFIKYYFVVETAANSDVSQSSVYIWRNGPNDVLHAGPVWDYDIAFGNYEQERFGGNPVQDYVKNARVLRAQGGNDWFTQLFRNHEFVTLANEMFETQLEPKISALVGEIDAHSAKIASSATANFDRWTAVLDSPAQFYLGHPVAASWSAEVTQLRSWLAIRVAHLASAYGAGMPVLQYSSHVSAIGWQNSLSGGQIAGTEGRGLQVEAMDIALLQNGYSGSIQSRAHVQATGWTGWQTGDSRVGTTGKGLQLEAVQFRLTGDVAARYNIAYRVHVQGVGWMDWVGNGKVAGTSGRGLQVEALQIRLLEKAMGDQAPAETSSVTYEAHVQAHGWLPKVSDGSLAGTTGQSLSMQALRATVESTRYSGDLEYRAHVQGIGWMDWTDSSEYVGTVGRGLRMEAVEIRLTGEIADHYSVRYSAHVQGIGWIDWTSEGQAAGTTGRGLQIEGLKIELVPKAP